MSTTADTPTNPFRERGSVVVRLADFPGEGDLFESRFPFPSMLLTEAYEWERRSGRKQSEFWAAVAGGEAIALQFLLWQAMRRQPGDDPEGNPWSMLPWDAIPLDSDLFRLSYDVEDAEGNALSEDVDAESPTTSNEEGSITD